MVENRSSLFGIIALIIGASGLGLGAFSVMNFQVAEGPQGLPGEDAPGGIVVGILNPNNGELVWGNILIKALVYGSENFTVSILLNDTILISNTLPTIWNSSAVSESWWNITVLITDNDTNVSSSDYILVKVDRKAYSALRSTWYNEYFSYLEVEPTFTYIPIYPLIINFEVEQGESVYFSYNGQLGVPEHAVVRFRFFIDNQTLSSPSVQVGTATYEEAFFAVSLQHFSETFSPGNHNVTIVVYSGYQNCIVDDNTLLVQTYL